MLPPPPDRMMDFRENGFTVLRRFLIGTALTELQDRVDDFIARVVPELPPEQAFYERKGDPASLKQIQQMGAHDAWFHQLFESGPFRPVAEQLLDGPVVPRNMQYFNKPPGIGQPTPPHQDGYYFMIDPCSAVTMWLALDDVDEENGCVRYVTGSHHNGMREHARTNTLGFSQGIVGYPTATDTAGETPITARAGDLIVHDALTIHRADGNRGDTRSRKALGLIFYSERAREDAAAHAAYQRQLAKDMKAEGKI